MHSVSKVSCTRTRHNVPDQDFDSDCLVRSPAHQPFGYCCSHNWCKKDYQSCGTTDVGNLKVQISFVQTLLCSISQYWPFQPLFLLIYILPTSTKLKGYVYLISMPVSFLYILSILVELSWNKKYAWNLLKLKKTKQFGMRVEVFPIYSFSIPVWSKIKKRKLIYNSIFIWLYINQTGPID